MVSGLSSRMREHSNLSALQLTSVPVVPRYDLKPSYNSRIRKRNRTTRLRAQKHENEKTRKAESVRERETEGMMSR